MASVTRSSPRPRTGGRHRRQQRGKPPLRVAVFADSLRQPAWLVEALAAVARSDIAEVVLVAVIEPLADTKAPSPERELPWLWRAYRGLDQWLFRQRGKASATSDLRSIAPAAPSLGEALTASNSANNSTGHLAEAWRHAVTAMPPLDVAFVLGELDDGTFENIARYGVWRYCFGSEHGTREALAGLREVARGQPVTRIGLRVRLWPGASRLLYQSTSRTYPFSVAKNRANLFGKAALFAERELRQLHRQGMARLLTPGESLSSLPTMPPEPSRLCSSAPGAPGLAETLGGLARIGGRILQRGWQKLSQVDQWSIAFRFGPPGLEDDGDGNVGLAHFETYTHLRPPPDRIWADPFPICRNGRYYIFFEEVPLTLNRGHIAVTEVFPDGRHTPPQIVLSENHHLSYPFLILDDDRLYMVPESGANRSVELYRCRRFPDLWQREKVLLDNVACADATFHKADDRWWMFVNIGADGTELYDELHLYYADRLTGEWRPHPENPVKSDVCSARPAGRMFVHKGILHRPAQICAPLYGSGIAIAEVRELTPEHYREEVTHRILPPPGSGLLGLHTLNRAGELNVIDCFARRRRF